MSTAKQTSTTVREPTEKWRRLPERIRPDETVESVALEGTPPPVPTSAGDPETAWMLRYS